MMELPFARRTRCLIEIDGQTTAEIELRELTLRDMTDETLAAAYGWLADFIIGMQTERRGALEINAIGVGKLFICLSACATVVDAPDGFTLAHLHARHAPPLTEAFAKLHFFDAASLQGLAMRGTLLAPMLKDAASANGSATPAPGATSSSPAATRSPTSNASASPKSARSSTPRPAAATASEPSS